MPDPPRPPRHVGAHAIYPEDSAQAPIVTVFGATGQQGGSVVRALLDDGRYRVRAVTRHKHSSAAQRFDDYPEHVDVVEANLNDDALVHHAVAGSFAVFGVTNAWDPQAHKQEFDQGERLAKISKEEGVQIFIWAGLPNVDRISGGKLDVEHFTDKARVWEVVKAQGFPACVSLEAASYFSNFEAGNVRRNEDGSATLTLPVLSAEDRLAGYDVDDTGAPITEILDNPQRYNKKRIVFASVYNEPVSQYVKALSQVSGVDAKLETKPYEEAAAVSKDFANMFVYLKEHGYYGGEADLVDANEVTKIPLTTFDQWLLKSSVLAQFKDP